MLPNQLRIKLYPTIFFIWKGFIMLDNDYKYELKYTYKDKVCTISFNGEITFNQLVSNIQDFLYSCGWSEDTVKRQIKTEEDMWEESEKENKE